MIAGEDNLWATGIFLEFFFGVLWIIRVIWLHVGLRDLLDIKKNL
jgi:hypothetical protein